MLSPITEIYTEEDMGTHYFQLNDILGEVDFSIDAGYRLFQEGLKGYISLEVAKEYTLTDKGNPARKPIEQFADRLIDNSIGIDQDGMKIIDIRPSQLLFGDKESRERVIAIASAVQKIRPDVEVRLSIGSKNKTFNSDMAPEDNNGKSSKEIEEREASVRRMLKNKVINYLLSLTEIQHHRMYSKDN